MQSDNEIRSFNRIWHEKYFSWKIMQKTGGETSLRSFFEKAKLSMSLDEQSEVSYSLLLWYVEVEDNQNILKLNC